MFPKMKKSVAGLLLILKLRLLDWQHIFKDSIFLLLYFFFHSIKLSLSKANIFTSKKIAATKQSKFKTMQRSVNSGEETNFIFC